MLQCLQRTEQREHIMTRLGHRQPLARELVGQRLALQVLHDEEVDGGLLGLSTRRRQRHLVTNVVERADMRVVEARDRARLTFKPVSQVGFAGKALRKHLDGHRTAEPRIGRFVHLTYAPGAELGTNFVRAEACAGAQ